MFFILFFFTFCAYARKPLIETVTSASASIIQDGGSINLQAKRQPRFQGFSKGTRLEGVGFALGEIRELREL